MVHEKLREILDALPEGELLRLRRAVQETPDGSTQEISGVQVSKDQALLLINQALPVKES